MDESKGQVEHRLISSRANLPLLKRDVNGIYLKQKEYVYVTF